MKSLFKKEYIAELIGTFALVFFGTGSVIVNSLYNDSLGLIGISATFGIVVAMVIYIFGGISGAHINPAVTIGLAVGKKFQKKKIIPYILYQIIGAFFASFLLYYLFPLTSTFGETLPSGISFQSFIVEFIATFFLMISILGITSDPSKEVRALAGIIIGITVTGLILFSGPISGGSFNPARSIAPAFISGNIETLWIYIIAPIFGSITAMYVWLQLKK